MSNEEKTHFGYQTIPKSEKKQRVREVFQQTAPKDDLMNDLMSFGLHRLWKRIAVELAGVREGQSVLDVAGGSGDLSRHFAKRVGKQGQVILSDINSEMLAVGRDKILDTGLLAQVSCCLADAENLPFPLETFDCISIGFGLRNVTDKSKALRSMFDCLRPGGRLLVLEFSKPILPGLKPFYDLYSFQILPRIGQWVVKDRDSYQYLAESIRMHPDQQAQKQMILAAGFAKCDIFNLAGGIVAIHRAFKY